MLGNCSVFIWNILMSLEGHRCKDHQGRVYKIHLWQIACHRSSRYVVISIVIENRFWFILFTCIPPPSKLRLLGGRQTKLCNFSYKYTHFIHCQNNTYNIALSQDLTCAARAELMVDYLQNWCGIKSIQYISLFFSGPIEQLPDYNRIRSGMYWMRTWELVLSLDT